MRNTKGRGVNFVLNSLSDEKLLASVRCMARGGVFLEIGKFDIMNNSSLGMSAFEKEITFRAVFADNLINMPDERKIIHELIDKDIRTGVIQPLHSTVFHVNEIEHAYRFMSTGKHVGKVMIQIRETESTLASVPIIVNPKVYCKSDYVYVVCGGMGGFGLELCDWLVIRGARFLVINSRRGVTTSYQAYRIRYGVKNNNSPLFPIFNFESLHFSQPLGALWMQSHREYRRYQYTSRGQKIACRIIILWSNWWHI